MLIRAVAAKFDQIRTSINNFRFCYICLMTYKSLFSVSQAASYLQTLIDVDCPNGRLHYREVFIHPLHPICCAILLSRGQNYS
jgi:hypothetical protein